MRLVRFRHGDRIATGALAEDARAELAFRLDDEERDALSALALAHGLAFEVTADDGDVVPGQTFAVQATVRYSRTHGITRVIAMFTLVKI